jgi:hypothetical protein
MRTLRWSEQDSMTCADTNNYSFKGCYYRYSDPTYSARITIYVLEEVMELLLIILVLFFLFGGGGYYGYRRWR